MATIVINDKHIQPPTAQTQHFDGQEEVDKGLERDKRIVAEAEKTTNMRDSNVVNDEDEDIDVPEIDIGEGHWLSRSRTAYDASTSYFENNIRGDLDDSINAFHNKHKSSSHFSTTTSNFSSKVYRPKTRAVITKYEAAADAAYFSNPDVVSIEAENPSNKNEVLGAAVTKAILQYRLTKTVPWYQIVIGGFQDAQVQGLAIAHYYWKVKVKQHSEQDPLTKEVMVSDYLHTDEPAIDLIPLENFRFDPNASWMNIVETSPFLIHMRPMYVCDVKAQVAKGYFKEVSESDYMSAAGSSKDFMATRQARAQSGQDPREKSSKELGDYEIVMVQEHIHRIEDEDYVWFTLNNEVMLRDPVLLEELYFTGERPYVIGSCALETHNTYVSSTPNLLSGLQEEINEVANQRLNNVKLALNKKFIVRTDAEIDLASLLRNQPGSAVYTQNPAEDVRELSTPDVTQSSYLEQDRLNGDFDELAGNFSSNSIQQQQSNQATWHGMQMLNSNANVQLEHQLRIFTDTFVTPLLRAIVKLEQKYETNDTIFALVGQQNADLFQKFGQSPEIDELLQHELTIKCNVGMNNTDPMIKQQRLINALGVILNISKNPASRGLDMKEVAKEIFASSGFGDGMRFLNQEVDPAMAQLMQENAILKKKVQDKSNHDNVELQKVRETNQTKLTIAQMKERTNVNKFLVDHSVSQEAANKPAAPQEPQPGAM